MNGSKDHLMPHFAVENEMVGIRLDALAEGQLIDAETAIDISNELTRLGIKLRVTLAGVKVEAAHLDFEEKNEEKEFILRALTERLGLNGAK